MNEDHIRINVFIGGRNYPLRIKPSEEENIRAIGDKIKAMISDLQVRYPGRDLQDYLAMCILTITTDPSQLANISGPSQTEAKIQNVEGWLDKIIG
jgi:cell division protein ZapA